MTFSQKPRPRLTNIWTKVNKSLARRFGAGWLLSSVLLFASFALFPPSFPLAVIALIVACGAPIWVYLIKKEITSTPPGPWEPFARVMGAVSVALLVAPVILMTLFVGSSQWATPTNHSQITSSIVFPGMVVWVWVMLSWLAVTVTAGILHDSKRGLHI